MYRAGTNSQLNQVVLGEVGLHAAAPGCARQIGAETEAGLTSGIKIFTLNLCLCEETPPPANQCDETRLPAMTTSICLQTPKEFSFEECLVYLNRSPLERCHAVARSRVRKLLDLGGQDCLIEVAEAPKQTLKVDFLYGTPLRRAERYGDYVREWFDLDRDLQPFYTRAAGDELLQYLTRRFFGLRIVKIVDLFAALCWAILGQQVNIRFAYTLYNRFIAAYGRSVEYEGVAYWLFPRPEDIASLPVKALRALQFTGRKAEYILGLAQEFDRGSISRKQLLAAGDFEKARQTLTSIRGIGPWTADYVLMRCLGDPDAFPVADAGLHNALRNALSREDKPTIAEVEGLVARWAGWGSYAAFYLYRSLIQVGKEMDSGFSSEENES